MAEKVSIFKSRKFWLLITDTLLSLAMYFISRYLPGAEADAKFLIGALQPVFIMVIAGIAIEDAAMKGSKPMA